MNKTLDILSLIGSYAVAFSVLILLQEFTIGQISAFREAQITDNIPLRFVVFPITSALLIGRFLKVHIPTRS